MSDHPQGPDWWQASDGRYYPLHTHPAYAPRPPYQPQQNNGCIIALAVVGGIVVASIVSLVALGLLFASDVEDATNVAGRDNGVTMTLAEFDRIENGMTLKQVEAIVGGPGALMSSAGEGEFKTELYTWDGAGSFVANANVTFQNDKVIGKAQFGLG